MSCPNEEKLAAFAEGDLSEEEQEKIREHLNSCASCRTEKNRFDQLLNRLNDREQPEVDSAFVQRVMNEAEYHLLENQSSRTSRTGWTLPRLRIFIRRNAPWLASLSLHCCLIFLVLLLVVNQFTGTTASSTGEEVLTGVPMMSTEDGPDVRTYRERLVWRGRLRNLRAGTASADAHCPGDNTQSELIKRTSQKLLSLRSEHGFWAEPNDERRVEPTALAVLALLRGGALPDPTGSEPATATYEGLTFLVNQQENSGRIGPDEAPMSVHASATAALLEGSLFTPSLKHQRGALNALDYLVQTVSSGKDPRHFGYWTMVSLKLGENLGHPRAGRLLRTSLTNGSEQPDDDLPPDLLRLPFQPAGNVTGSHKKRAHNLRNQWIESRTKNKRSSLQTNTPIGLAQLMYTIDEPGFQWTEIRDHLQDHVQLDQLDSPSQLARFALILRTCRSYPR